jgi:hypothetical protein
MEAQVRFPGGRRSCGSAPVRPRAGFSGRAEGFNGVSGPGTDKTRGSRALAAPRQGARRQISCRQGQCQQRRQQWVLIRVQQPLEEATRLLGAQAPRCFPFVLRNANARSCVQQVCCNFDSLTAALSLNCQVRRWMHLVLFLIKGGMGWSASVEPRELSVGSRNAAGRRFLGHYRCFGRVVQCLASFDKKKIVLNSW